MLLSAYIELLKEMLEKHGDYPVCMTEDGYYADGPFAELYEEVGPPKEIKHSWSEYHPNGGTIRHDNESLGHFYILGNSSQNY